MAKLKIPSLQHLARNWRDDPRRIKKLLVDLARNPPSFGYNPLYLAVRDMLVFRQPYDEIVEGIRRAIKREEVRANLLSVLPLIRDHFDGVAPTFVQAIDRRYYPVGRDLFVPFDPPLIYGTAGVVHFPWFSFWRNNPLANERLQLFVSIVDDVLLQDPDLEETKFVILDFSTPAPKEPRELKVIDAQKIPRISVERVAEMLSTFAEGYSLARAELAGELRVEPQVESETDVDRGDQPDLFDDDR